MAELKLPRIGFGTWQLKPKDCINAVLKAIEIGYRHIDTAQMYRNEEAVGKAIQEATIDRKELIIATKLAIWRLRPGSVISSTNKSLKKLGLDYVDLLYIHWPAPIFYRPKKTLKAMSKLVDEGKVKHIAVSNFTPKLIDKALEVCDKPIVAAQVEHHPWLRQEELRTYLKEKGMYLVAYSPLARGKVFKIPELTQIAKKHHASEAQVALSWIMQHEAVPIPKSTTEDHIRDNFEALNLILDPEDIQLIDSIQKQKRLINPPIIRPKW
ncbi:MAG: aldo/keto reductase [Candidatus Helarchaeota archaeon]